MISPALRLKESLPLPKKPINTSSLLKGLTETIGNLDDKKNKVKILLEKLGGKLSGRKNGRKND